MLQAFVCEKCPLGFEIGSFTDWELSGWTKLLVCVRCGTMHRLCFARSDGPVDFTSDNLVPLRSAPGTTELYALPGPIVDQLPETTRNWFGKTVERYRDPATWHSTDDWLLVRRWDTQEDFPMMNCSNCDQDACLICLEHPTNENGEWPAFRDSEGETQCPLCGEKITMICDTTVN